MCDSIADGGQRCAYHSRPRFRAAIPGTQAWDDAAADYAATPTGRQELEASLEQVVASGKIGMEAALRAALRFGQSRREAYLEVRSKTASLREQLRKDGAKGDDFWAAEMLTCIYSADKIVDRGEDVFFEEGNTVEIAAARQHIVDLDTAADGLSPGFRDGHREIPWKPLARMRDRNAHHYDNVNRDIVWNVLVVEFPKIRLILRQHLGI